ncbi:hypothetical protein A0H81_13201 [Grifola frondosa]|uniref:Uncharacterized protein n=1 Tax=Grifola frondosa TaxID=5627 RepID=A0A1C7LPM9_GRIFR|nr:hypothetical protein A0H81_13201 [Grifola frondosa]
MSLRPKIVKLIDKYSQKRADLVSMNESFVKARTIFDRMMEESLARHTAMYDGRPPYVQAPSQPYIGRPESRARQEYAGPGAPQAYGWNPSLYDQPGYNAYPAPASAYPPAAETHILAQGTRNSSRMSTRTRMRSASRCSASRSLMVHQPRTQSPPQRPPYVYDPNITYADANVQAWAQYYAHGGTDPTGSVYFISVPGVKEGPSSQPPRTEPSRTGSQGTVHAVQQSQPVVNQAMDRASTIDRGIYAAQQVDLGQDSTGATATAPLNVQTGAATGDAAGVQPEGVAAMPGSPVAQNVQFSQSAIPVVSSPIASSPGGGIAPHQMAYGASPYDQPGYAASAGPGAPPQNSPPAAGSDPNVGTQPHGTWPVQQQYYGLPNQFAGMNISGDERQSAHSGPQGVGTPA